MILIKFLLHLQRLLLNPAGRSQSRLLDDARAGPILFSLASYDSFSAFMREWTPSRPADHAAMSGPALMMDVYRKLEPFMRGMLDGLVREQMLQAIMSKPDPVCGTSHVTLLTGPTDFMQDANENAAYRREVLPDAQLVVLEDAGRFISYSHRGKVVAALDRQPGQG